MDQNNDDKPEKAPGMDGGYGPAEGRKIPATTKEFMLFMLYRIIEKKKWMLLPLWALLLAIALVLVLSGNVHLLPAIYIAF